MREYEIHATVSYISGGAKYYNCYCEYVNANSKADARKIYKAQLAEEDIKLVSAEIWEV